MGAPQLTAELLLRAYANGYFPMAEPQTGEIGWFHPDPRAILPLDGFHLSRSLKKVIDKKNFRVSFDTAFDSVMAGCADRDDTWISDEIFRVYGQLFNLGYGHSVEVWHEGELAGGLYGVALGGAFFAESKFHRVTNASKVAVWALVERMKKSGMSLLEVQYLTPHLASLGAIEVTDREYKRRLRDALRADILF